jgi:predicted metal-dependent hydrolase
VRSVRHFQKNLTNPLLKEEVKGFIGQEAHHGNEHEHFNALMQKKGLPTKKIEEFVLNGLKWQGKHLSPERQLAKTCALEHFTAMLAETILEYPDFFAGMDDRLLPLWLWHAVEESEHKAVAFDVYQDQVNNYWVRTSEMAFTTLEFIGFQTLHYWQLRNAMTDKTDWKSMADGMKWLLGKNGFLRKLGPAYLSYYKRDFHPNQRDSRALRDAGLIKLAAMLKRPELLESAA